MGNKITNGTKEAVLNMLNDGKSKVEIAEKCSISPFSVERIIYNAQFIDVVFESGNKVVRKLKPKEKPEIKRIETDYKPIKALRNFICGIDFIILGLAAIAVQNGMETMDGTAAVMLLVMGLTAIFNRD